MHERVTPDQRIARTELIVDSWVQCPTALSNAKNICKWIDDGERRRVECCSIDDSAVIDGVPANIEIGRPALAERATDVSAIFLEEEWGLLLRVRISRVPEIVREILEHGTVKLAGARLRQNFDSAGTELVIFRSEGILVDPNLTNGLL